LKTVGEAFGVRPAIAGVSARNKVTGYLGKGLVNTFLTVDHIFQSNRSMPSSLPVERSTADSGALHGNP
jgi:hypothetical protein